MKTIVCRSLEHASVNNERQFAALKILRLVQAPFGFVFWLLEQRIAQIEDHLAREGCCK